MRRAFENDDMHTLLPSGHQDIPDWPEREHYRFSPGIGRIDPGYAQMSGS